MIAELSQIVESAFLWVVRTSWQAGLLAGGILLLGVALRRALHPTWRYLLWFVLIARLLLPALPSSRVSIHEVVPFPLEQAITSAPLAASSSPEVALATPSAESQVETPGASLSPVQWLAWAWALGMGVALGVGLTSHLRFRRQLRTARRVDSPALLAQARFAADELGLKRLPQIVETSCVGTPALFGFIRSQLLLPEGLAASLSHEELRMVFLHEFAHLRRWDVAVNTLCAVLQMIHWFNPVLWLAFRRMRQDRELATDALVLSRGRVAERQLYGETLLRIITGAGENPRTVVGMIDSTRDLKERFRHIGRAAPVGMRGVLFGAVILLALTFTSLTGEILRSTHAPHSVTEKNRAARAMVAGYQITPEEARELREALAKASDAPGSVELREKLLAYYSRTRFQHKDPADKAYREELLLWIIRHQPDSAFAGQPSMSVDHTLEAELYKKVAEAWEEQLRKHPKNARLIQNLAVFYASGNSKRSLQLLEQGVALEPENYEWYQALGQHYHRQMLRIPSDSPEVRALARKALPYREKVVELAPADSRFYSMGDLAVTAFDAGEAARATQLAQAYLKEAERQPKDWNYGNAVYTAHTLLGKLALNAGKIEEAKRHLLAAGKTPGSPQLGSFGPQDWALPSALSERGETETVLTFLSDVERFWKHYPKTLERLRALTREKKPYPLQGTMLSSTLLSQQDEGK